MWQLSQTGGVAMLACLDPVSLIMALFIEIVIPVFWFLLNVFCMTLLHK